MYYPTINVPTNSWLRHALLYWDEVGSIMPESIDTEELSTDIHYLMEEGFFKPVRPESLLQKSGELLEAFEKEFMGIVETKAFHAYVSKQRLSMARIKREKLIPSRFTARVHANKTSYTIQEFLVEKGLASGRERDGWFFFERHTALVYMSLLAKYIAEFSSGHMTIGTDHGIYEKFNFGPLTEQHLYPVINVNLSRLLPVPRANVPLEKLIDFKKDRKDNLRHFRKLLLEFQGKLSKAKSNAEFKDLTFGFRDQLEMGIKDLAATFKDAKMEAFFKTMKSMINFKSPVLLVGGAVLANQHFKLIDAPINFTVMGMVVAGTIEVGSQMAELRSKIQSKKRESPFAYLYHAQRENILKGAKGR